MGLVYSTCRCSNSKEAFDKEESDFDQLSEEAAAPTSSDDMGASKSKTEKLATKVAFIHQKARGAVYPQAPGNIKRCSVSDAQVPWNVECKEYKPVLYNSPRVIEKPVWADPDVGEEKFKLIKFNDVDGKVNRVSFSGKYDIGKDGLPRNIMGRTGMIGRGLLGKWGPNHAADPLVTRWKRNKENEKVYIDGKPILEIVAVMRGDTKEWAIPGGMVDNGENVSLTLKREFGEEALNSLEIDSKEEVKKAIDDLFNHGETIYQGYVDDPRNTDNAWMETTAVNFHDEDNTTVGKIPLHAGDDALEVQWLSIDKKLNLYASHEQFVEKVCELRGAYFVK